MTTSTPEKQDGLKILQDAIEKIKATITDLGGVFNIQMAVRFCNASTVQHNIYKTQIYNKKLASIRDLIKLLYSELL